MYDGYWWCAECHEEVDCRRVTSQELHDTCGRPVIWVEPKDPVALLRDQIAALQAENAEKDKRISRVEAERDAAIADISHVCATCGRFDDGMCPVLRYKDYTKDCEHWQWRGVQGVE